MKFKFFVSLPTWAGAVFCLFLLTPSLVLGQLPETKDTSQQLQEVVVSGYLSQQPLLQTPASVGIVNSAQLRSMTEISLLPAFNLIPGVRMEERSPGSYRLSIRGSLLRSPFGLRNVKVYVDDYPLTDASGNTYINLIDPKVIERIEVLKGPDGSLFGANSGGVILMDLHGRNKDSSEILVGLSGGSYGMMHENASVVFVSGESRLSFNQAYQQADNYRQHSDLKRYYLQVAGSKSYGKSHKVKMLVLYSGLQYQTPGGLTQAQYETDPGQARLATGFSPGAEEQQAGIFNNTLFAGITNELFITDQLRYVTSIFGTHTDFENPFITNFETRKEKNLGIRTFAEYVGKEKANIYWKWSLGLEGQQGWQEISNFENNGGIAGMPIAVDEVNIRQVFYFTRLRITTWNRLTTEVALSLNANSYNYTGWTSDGKRTFASQWMPRIAMTYLLNADLAIRATLSRGYSPPTLAEIRSSNQIFDTYLQPESGWNREVGFRLTAWRGRLQADASVFRYNLSNAIVRRLDPAGVEYFVNAGGTKQTGIETFISAWLIPPQQTGVIRAVQMTGTFTYSHFVFSDYQDAVADYSGNRLTGVPQTVLVLGLTLRFPRDISLYTALNATSKLPLNDANTVYAGEYHLLQAKLSWPLLNSKKTGLEIFAGADNILNEKYSLGNDINAFGGRYFNAAAPLSFYGGVKARF
jgi:iron complex outermembrane receptor protein